jgi:hypothetical protein
LFTGQWQKLQVPAKDYVTKQEIPGKTVTKYRFQVYDLTSFDSNNSPEPAIWERGLVEDELVGEPCRCCGVIYGNVHHVGCDSQSCPVDYDGQFLGCGHDMYAKYLKGPNDFKYHPGLYKQLQVKDRSVGKK